MVAKLVRSASFPCASCSAIAQKLRGRERHEVRHLAKQYTENPEAYEAYLKGEYYAAKFSKDGMNKALGEFQRAVEIDPTYAPAYAEMGYAYWMLTQPLDSLIPKDGMPKAKAAALKALHAAVTPIWTSRS
jgi:tetratricopeptide (TPR) repeat protein